MFEQGAKSHLPDESRGDITGRGSARESATTRDTTGRGSAMESASTRASAKRDVSLGVEATSRDKESHDHLLKEIRKGITGRKSAKESASIGASAKRDAEPRSGGNSEGASREGEENTPF